MPRLAGITDLTDDLRAEMALSSSIGGNIGKAVAGREIQQEKQRQQKIIGNIAAFTAEGIQNNYTPQEMLDGYYKIPGFTDVQIGKQIQQAEIKRRLNRSSFDPIGKLLDQQRKAFLAGNDEEHTRIGREIEKIQSQRAAVKQKRSDASDQLESAAQSGLKWLEADGIPKEVGTQTIDGETIPADIKTIGDYIKFKQGSPETESAIGEIPSRENILPKESRPDDAVSVEINGKETEIPTLVPTLTEKEKALMVNDIIPNKKEIPQAIANKAIIHANKQINAGKSPFQFFGGAFMQKKADPKPKDKQDVIGQFGGVIIPKKVSPNQARKKTEAKVLTDEDKQAIAWAKKNPDDPRAKQILEMHGVK